ncbi:putative NRPS-like protein biosynthetic cluster [Aspergillus brasiliensis]|uniref:NRPS-like protein biosynthetic cluster n=1 Tax=Aspergillus brasiliensis TaxID=319629 RepID=A0A9W6DRX4_9EURO|nr:putative NRPS-like protein biosynthetic cluster [Aspergillus brasiliensis]GKZ49288.1 putative NRPS-like protein biosynthetic cluster [Aspergillus brasiliensis]
MPFLLETQTLARTDGSTQIPLLEQPIGECFRRVVSASPDQIAIHSGTRHITYGELHAQSDAFALGLIELGIRAGDRVALSLGNGIEYAVIAYACFKLGAILTPLNPGYLPGQVIHALNHITARCFITSTEIKLPHKDPRLTSELLQEIATSSDPSTLSTTVPSLQHLLLIDNSGGRVDVTALPVTADYEALILAHGSQRLPPQDHLGAEDVANLQFTSGTTSAPKAVCLTHRNILNNAYLVGQGMELSAGEVVCCPPPLHHCFGLVLGLLTAMIHRATLLLPSPSFDARATLQSIAEHNATVLFIQKSALRHLRTGIIGGSPIAPSLRLRLHQHMNLSGLTNCYGLTEASPIVCMTGVLDCLDKRLTSVGQVLPHTAIRIADRNNPTRTLPRGDNQRGELQISGYAVMAGYWDAPEETARTLLVDEEEIDPQTQRKRIWLRTGDEATMGVDGTIRITGRIKDIIIRGGENIYPGEIEDALLTHPQVANVGVVGLADAIYGEVPAAFVVLRVETPPEELRAWVRQKCPAAMVPKHVFAVDRLPLTASGKLEKYKLREMGERWLQ